MDKGEEKDTPVTSGDNLGANNNSSSASHVFGRNHRNEKHDYKEAPQFFKDAMSENDVIYVNNYDNRKGGKKIILLVIIALLIVVAVVLAVLFLGKRVSEGNLSSKFNRYVNFVVSGSDSSEKYTKEFNSKEKYYFHSINPLDEQSKDTVEKLKSLESSFSAAFDAARESIENQDLVRAYDLQKEEFDFIIAVYTKKRLTERDIYTYYNTNGYSATQKYLNEYYNTSNISNNILKEYFEDYRQWSFSVMATIQTYDLYSCLIGEGKTAGDDSCVKRKTDAETYKVLENQKDIISEMSSDMNSYNNIVYDYVHSLLDLNKYMSELK